jgi:type I restriction enzyme S subunit
VGTVEGWRSVTVEQCCEILDSKRIPINGEDREKRIGDIPYYGANGLQGHIDDYIFDEPLILIAEDGGCFDEFATRPIAYRVTGKSWVNNHAHVLRAKEGFAHDAVFYALEHKDIQSFIVGGTRSKLNQSALRSIAVDLPASKPEQTKIAEILSTVDRAIEQTEALIAKQQRIKTGLMQDLLTRGIDEHGNIRSEQTHKFKDSPLGRIPVEWEAKQLSTVVELKVGYAFKSSWFCEDGIRLLRGENVGAGIPDWKDMRCLPPEVANKFRDYQLNAGDMIIGMDRTFTKQGFKVSILGEDDVPCLLVQRVGFFVPMAVPCGFMQLLIQSPIYQRALRLRQKGMDIPHLSKDEILSPLVPIPGTLDEMNAISNHIESLRSTERNNAYCLNKLLSLKAALMQDLLTGKKRVMALLNGTGGMNL